MPSNSYFHKRLRDVIHALRIEHQAFARAGGISKATLSGYVQSDRQPKVDTLAKWVEAFEINANWLLTGNGPMFQGGKEEATEGESGPKTQAGKELAEIKMALQEIGATEAEIRQALLDHVSGGKTPLTRATGTDDDDSRP